MRFFLRPKSRIRVPKPIALSMNVLNMLGPCLLGLALLIMLYSQFGDHDLTVRHTLLRMAVILIGLALVIRLVWGISVHIIAKKHKNIPQ